MRKALLSLAAVQAAGHGAMQQPRSWFDPHGTVGMKAGEQCFAGCDGTAPGQKEAGSRGCACQWYTNWTHIPGAPTIPRKSPLRTYVDWDFGQGPSDWTAANPWRAPGSAPIFSPCGIDGGNPKGCPVGNEDPNNCAAGGYSRGPDARDIYEKFSPATTSWEAGSVVEAAWGITANHGGGYTYRICKKPISGDMSLLTEECFQANVLEFVGDVQWAEFGEDHSKRIGFPAVRTSEGTLPKGSTWTRNPIPACMGPGGGTGYGHKGEKCGTGPWGNSTGPGVQFPPPFPYGYGFGNHAPKPGGVLMFSIVDRIKVPENLEPGEYVVSWRWDAEQTPQVWSSCANVRVTGRRSTFI